MNKTLICEWNDKIAQEVSLNIYIGKKEAKKKKLYTFVLFGCGCGYKNSVNRMRNWFFFSSINSAAQDLLRKLVNVVVHSNLL